MVEGTGVVTEGVLVAFMAAAILEEVMPEALVVSMAEVTSGADILEDFVIRDLAVLVFIRASLFMGLPTMLGHTIRILPITPILLMERRLVLPSILNKGVCRKSNLSN